ncbi:hypothetical protein N7520_007279 [Penicillium odoratum]|uniref:uncharacterized protein n=1 Tax=Penicillium odoratum TaxID=1167516 RepID=UPI002548B172|nr:uncharacterized protein N7520_007279 [Penicillium odoratum]KAJ5760123.1 hypothetical protein N7520_007279 [Penicillium odoratum]
MSPITVESFHSKANPAQSVSYVHLNQGAPNTLVYCYGAGGDSRLMGLFEPFLQSHPDLSLICIDRWVQGKDAARIGLALLAELSAIALELLDTLNIDQFSIAAHSAGAYPMLDLARYAPPGRVGNVFPLCTHIPAAYTGSRIMESMCTMPGFMFKVVTKLDSGSTPKWLEDLLVGLMTKKAGGVKEEGGLVISGERKKLVLEKMKDDVQGEQLWSERMDLDYRLGYERVEGITREILTGLYRDCPIDITWFTAEGEVFFGLESARRISEEMKAKTEIVDVSGATHADIMLWTQVWDSMYSKIVHETETEAGNVLV